MNLRQVCQATVEMSSFSHSRHVGLCHVRRSGEACRSEIVLGCPEEGPDVVETLADPVRQS